MIGWLLYSEKDIKKNKIYIDYYFDEGTKLGIQILLIVIEKLKFGIQKNSWFLTYHGKAVTMPDFAICRTIYPLLNKQLEYMGLKVFNNSDVADICNDKAKTYQYIANLGIPVIDTEFFRNSMIEEAMSTINSPTVIKSVDGHGGNQVFLIEPSDSTKVVQNNIMNQLGKSDIVLQPLIGSRHQDLRIYVIGNQIIAAILRTAKEGFKSNYSLGGKVEQYQLSKKEISIVENIMNHLEFGLVGIDFIIGDEGELIFNEIEDVVGARMLYTCTDINLVRLYLEYIVSKLTNREWS